MDNSHKMWTNRRIGVIVTLIIIMILGAIISLTNQRPKSNREKNKSEVYLKNENINEINIQIKSLSDSIILTPKAYSLRLKRARLFKSINKFDEAISDYNYYLNNISSENTKIQQELQAVIKVKEFLVKQKQ